MKLFKKAKKGFTLVELVVVIAVIAILAAVSTITYVNITDKARHGNDVSFLGTLNSGLAASESYNGKKPSTMHEALEDLEEIIGISDPAKFLSAQSKDLEFAYDLANNRFVLLEGDKVVEHDATLDYSKDAIPAKDQYKYWKMVTSKVNESFNYSAYFAKNANVTGDFTTNAGVDFGYNTFSGTVTYKNTSDDAKDVVIRTNGQMSTLTINGKGGDNGDTVNHYGFANQVYVNSVGNKECYHEFGTSNILEAKAGKVVVESVGNVFEMKKSAEAVTDANAPTFKNNGGNILKAEAGTIAETEQVTNVYNINNYEQLCSFRDATNSGMTFAGITVNLNCDITLSGAWTPISNYYRKANTNGGIEQAFAGVFDGKNHTIKGLTNAGLTADNLNTGYNNSTPQGGTEYVYGFFASVNDATIKNVTFTDVNIVSISDLLGDCNAACVGFVNATNIDQNKVNIENIHVYGNVSGYDNVGGVVGMVRNVTDKDNKEDNHYFTVKGCTFEGTLYAVRRSAGIVAQLSSDIYEARLESCVAKGTASSNYSKDHQKSTDLPYYLCGGLATWGQTKRLNIVSCSSEMTTSAESVSTTVQGNLFNNFIIVEKTSSKTNATLDYTSYKVENNGHYYKDNNHVPTVVTE